MLSAVRDCRVGGAVPVDGDALEELLEGSVLTLTRLCILLGRAPQPMKSGAKVIDGHPLALVDGVADSTRAAIKRIQ